VFKSPITVLLIGTYFHPMMSSPAFINKFENKCIYIILKNNQSVLFFFIPNLMYLYQTLSCIKYSAIFVIISTAPILMPVLILPVMNELNTMVSRVPTIRHVIVFAKCLFTAILSVFVVLIFLEINEVQKYQ